MRIFINIAIIFFVSTALAFEENKLKTGHKLFSEVQQAPYQYIIFAFPFGSAEIPSQKQGTLGLLKEILNTGPIGQTEEDYRRIKFMHNTDIYFESNEENFFAILKFRENSLNKSLSLLEDLMAKPKIDDKNFQEKKQMLISKSSSLLDNPRSITSYFANKKLQQGDKSYLDGRSTPNTVKNIALNDAKDALSKISLREAQIFSFGPMSTKKIIQALSKDLPSFRERNRGFQKLETKPLSPSYLLQKAGAMDNQILYMQKIKMKPYSVDFAKSQIALGVLGGGMSSRLMQTLRVKGGLTYGAASWLQGANLDHSLWTIWTFGGIKQFPKLLKKIKEIMHEFSSEGVTDDEISEVKKIVTTEHKKNYELPFDLFEMKMSLRLQGYPIDYPDNFLNYINDINSNDLNLLIKRYFRFDTMTLFAHGDKNEILKYFPPKNSVVEIDKIQ